MTFQAPLILLFAALSWSLAWPAWAGVVVISNRTAEPLRLTAKMSDGDQAVTLAPSDLVSLASRSPVVVRWDGGKQSGERELAVDGAYFFYRDPNADELQLERIGLVDDDDGDFDFGGGEPATPPAGGVTTFTVKLLADEEERAARKLWESRLRNRLKAASAIFEHYCRVRFEVVAVETWKSNDAIDDFEESLADFRDRVPLGSARLAIGFTSQYEVPQGKTHLGGTYGPLAHHILLREWSQHLSEAERTELLVHELGHFLGAVHSLEADSVMRPMLGDKQAAARKFRIRFDPLNTLAICLVADECSARKIGSLRDLSRPTQRRLTNIYHTLAELMPDDSAAPQYYHLVTGDELAGYPIADAAQPDDARDRDDNRSQRKSADRTRPRRGQEAGPDQQVAVRTPTATGIGRLDPTHEPAATIDGDVKGSLAAAADLPPLVEATRGVLEAIVAAAEQNQRSPKGRQAGGEDLFRREADGLTEYYVQAAAAAAADVPQQYREKAFLLSLAIGLESSSWLREVPVLGTFLQQIEPDKQRRRRLEVLGEPTMRGRNDLVQHFMISAAITAMAGRRSAESAGVGKELRDSDGGSGFSFSDLAADLAGIEFAERVQAGTLPLRRLARRFHVTDFLPELTGLADGLSHREFMTRFGSTSDGRFTSACGKIRDRIAALPAYHDGPIR